MNRDELLLSVHVPALTASARSIYLRAMERKVLKNKPTSSG